MTTPAHPWTEHALVCKVSRCFCAAQILSRVDQCVETMASIKVVTLDDYWTFDYSAFQFAPKGDYLDSFRSGYGYFTHPALAFGCVAMYLLFSGAFCDAIRSSLGLKRDSSSIKWLTILHSFVLAVYSGWTFYNTLKITRSVHSLYMQSGEGWLSSFYSMCCDGDGLLWNKNDLGTWIWHFYISKYYEFVDTWIILLKGDKPMILQTYHHAGVVLIMWSICVTQNTTCGMILTVLNSGIHTIMYTYYTLTALKIKLPLKVLIKSFITSSQITQFVIGIASSAPTYFMSGCHSQASIMSQAVLHIYTVILIGLFLSFAHEEYILKAKKKG